MSAGKSILALSLLATLWLGGCCHRYDGVVAPVQPTWDVPTNPVGVANTVMTSLLTRSPYRDFQSRTLREAPLQPDQVSALGAVADALHQKLYQESHIQLTQSQAEYVLWLRLEPADTGQRLIAELMPEAGGEPVWTYAQVY